MKNPEEIDWQKPNKNTKIDWYTVIYDFGSLILMILFWVFILYLVAKGMGR